MGRHQTTKDFPRVQLRLPPEVYDALNEAAIKNFRSLNSEVILRLVQSIEAKELENT